MSSDEDLLADITVNEVVEQRRLAAAAQVSPFDNTPGGGAMSANLRAILGDSGGTAAPASVPADLSGIHQLGAAAVVQPSPMGGELTPGGGGGLAASTSQQMQQSAMAAAVLASLQTPRRPQSPPTQTPSPDLGIEAAILRKQKAPYDAVASQQNMMKEITGLLPGGGDWKDFKNYNRGPFDSARYQQEHSVSWNGYCVCGGPQGTQVSRGIHPPKRDAMAVAASEDLE